ncbi:hypothetical protein SVAN01_09618 [Stagonosporopsis vannaccii]|nr:hypothetical protein SVAN01_09618 [Stagonosporopsis vannaccii]
MGLPKRRLNVDRNAELHQQERPSPDIVIHFPRFDGRDSSITRPPASLERYRIASCSGGAQGGAEKPFGGFSKYRLLERFVNEGEWGHGEQVSKVEDGGAAEEDEGNNPFAEEGAEGDSIGQSSHGLRCLRQRGKSHLQYVWSAVYKGVGG